jgi:O-antigen/teichoic acid export membrane protein
LVLGVPRARGLAANAVWSFVGTVWPALMMVLGVPLFVHFLGVRDYGLWTLSNSLLALVGVLNFGLGDATTKYVAEHAALGERVEVTRILLATFLVYGMVGVVGSAGIWVASPLLARRMLHLGGAEANRAVAVFHLLACGFLPSVAIFSVQGYFEGLQRFRVSQILNMIRASAVVVLGGVLLAGGYGLVALTLAVVVAAWALLLLGVLLMLPDLVWPPASDWRLVPTLRKVVAFGVYSALTGVGVMVVGQLDKMLIGNVLGLEAVTYYSVPQSVASKAHGLCGSMAKVLMPFFSGQQASASEGFVGRVFRGWRVSILVSLFLLGILAASAPWLIHVWMGPSFGHRAAGILLLFLAFNFVHAFNIVPHYSLLAVGKPQWVAVVTSAGGGLMLLGIWLMTPAYGIWGAAWAGLLYPGTGLVMAVLLSRWLDAKSDSIVKGLSLPLAVHVAAAGLGAAAGYLVARMTQSQILALVVAVGVAGGVTLATYLLLRSTHNPFYRDAWSVVASVLQRPRILRS